MVLNDFSMQDRKVDFVIHKLIGLRLFVGVFTDPHVTSLDCIPYATDLHDFVSYCLGVGY